MKRQSTIMVGDCFANRVYTAWPNLRVWYIQQNTTKPLTRVGGLVARTVRLFVGCFIAGLCWLSRGRSVVREHYGEHSRNFRSTTLTDACSDKMANNRAKRNEDTTGTTLYQVVFMRDGRQAPVLLK